MTAKVGQFEVRYVSFVENVRIYKDILEIKRVGWNMLIYQLQCVTEFTNGVAQWIDRALSPSPLRMVFKRY